MVVYVNRIQEKVKGDTLYNYWNTTWIKRIIPVANADTGSTSRYPGDLQHPQQRGRKQLRSRAKTLGFSHLRHSGSMHFSVCSNSSTHSAGSDFSILCRVRTPRPHVTLHSLQSDQGDSMHGMVSADKRSAKWTNTQSQLALVKV